MSDLRSGREEQVYIPHDRAWAWTDGMTGKLVVIGDAAWSGFRVNRGLPPLRLPPRPMSLADFVTSGPTRGSAACER